ncbi:hypothetical protein SprV_0301341600 [Sparganum proliferum]
MSLESQVASGKCCPAPEPFCALVWVCEDAHKNRFRPALTRVLRPPLVGCRCSIPSGKVYRDDIDLSKYLYRVNFCFLLNIDI